MSAKILYVEDDANLSFVTKDNLEYEGFKVSHFKDGKKAYDSFCKEKFDLCLLDVMLPVLDGFALAEKIRKQNQSVPIIFLTAKSLQDDKILGLKIGADDYITKPFDIEELILRLKVFIKRKDILEEKNRVTFFKLSSYDFDHQQLTLKSSSRAEALTHREADVLRFLAERKNTVIKREDILKEIWGRDDYFLGRSLDVFITRLRKMLADDSSLKIENVHGVGFRFICE